MGRTVTLNEIKDHSVSDLMQEARRRQEPLIVMLEDGTAVSIQQYQPIEETIAEETIAEPPALKPLLTLPGFVPAGWKDELYDQQH